MEIESIKLDTGETVKVYQHRHKDIKVNANNCTTQYEETAKNSGIFKQI